VEGPHVNACRPPRRLRTTRFDQPKWDLRGGSFRTAKYNLFLLPKLGSGERAALHHLLAVERLHEATGEKLGSAAKMLERITGGSSVSAPLHGL